jgi:transketolase
MTTLPFISQEEFTRVRGGPRPGPERLALLADMCRLNALTAIKRAGSGHVGTTFSSLDIVATLYFRVMNTLSLDARDPDRDIYLSSKGHDAPGLYAVLFAAGRLAREPFLNLRRLGGVPGHPDVQTPGIEANTGSLGMGVSKAKGFAWSKRQRGRRGTVYVLTGDGEWQEGQGYEALQSAVHQRLTNLTVIVDHNRVQSDRLVEETASLGDFERKVQAFGWATARCDGHDPAALLAALERLRQTTDRPRLLIADTIKGRGVSFMEHPAALRAENGWYRWHAGAPPDDAYRRAVEEITARLEAGVAAAGLGPLRLGESAPAPAPTPASADHVGDAFGTALAAFGRARPDLVVLDGDLVNDCRLREFAAACPDRFIESGIAEQDMVSMAGALAREGWLPVVNSFAAFLAARANEQIANNAQERTKVIYACHYAGLLPAGPGASHQSLRDVAAFATLPACVILQPATPEEARQALAFCVEGTRDTAVLRLFLGPSPAPIELPAGYRLTLGRGAVLTEGTDAALFAYGPVMVAQALEAARRGLEQALAVRVINFPWLNRVDPAWVREAIGPCRLVAVAEDHAPAGGLGDLLIRQLAAQGSLQGRRAAVFGVEGHPACGTPEEVLRAHRLDGESLAQRLGQLDREGEASPEAAAAVRR